MLLFITTPLVYFMSFVGFEIASKMRSLQVSTKLLAGFVLISLCFVSVSVGKVCTNGGVSLSHTHRSRLFSSKNESLEGENLAHLHLIPSDDQTWSNLIPRKMLRQEDEVSWNILNRTTIKNFDGSRNSGIGFLNEVSLHDVRLDPDSIHGVAQQTNLEYLLMLDNDRLVWSFRKVAGLETPGEPYGGWESPKQELRGHFVGHYMSASALMWASTHNTELKDKMSLLVSALSECQKQMGTGYLSAFPSEFFDRFEALEQVWAPYYTIHKILAGLLDQYSLADNVEALNMTKWMVDYFYNRVQNVIAKHTIERHWLSLNEETGGMNDVLYRLYVITGDQRHLLLAHLFDKPCFLGLLAMMADDISGFHSNTHIPVVVGSQMRYEVTGDPLYKEISAFFMDIVNSSHSYATGGTSVGEFWSDPKRLGTTLETENEESCTTYNMLKVSRHLFRWTKEMVYADYYERALTNGVLGVQRGTEPGVMIYMLPLQPGGSKARSYHKWGTKFDSFWCCYGTGIESFSKLGDSIYFEEKGNSLRLYVVQYISSSFNWRAGQIVVSQRVEPVVSWDRRLQVTVTISAKEKAEGKSSTLMLRIPPWASSTGAKASLNGHALLLPEPGNFLSISNNWTSGDKIALDLPLNLRTEAIKDERPDFASVLAFLYGPYVLAGLSSGDWDIKIEPNITFSETITPVPADHNTHLITITQELENSTFALENSDRVIKMGKFPDAGTDAALKATFRLIPKNLKPLNYVSNEIIKLEPFDFPGMFVSHNGENKALGISNFSSSSTSDHGDESFFFRLVVPGLDGRDGTVSFESESRKGCFMYSEKAYDSGEGVSLNCSYNNSPSDVRYQRATSFVLKDGIAEYHPISFVAKGRKRNFLLVPLLSMRDESYTVYFNVSII